MADTLNPFQILKYMNDIKLAKKGNKEAFCRLINECYGLLRKRSKVTNLSDVIAVQFVDVGSDEKIDMDNALKALSYELRVVVVLFYFEDMPYKEIAAILNVAEGTVKSRLSRAKTKLQINLNSAVGGK